MAIGEAVKFGVPGYTTKFIKLPPRRHQIESLLVSGLIDPSRRSIGGDDCGNQNPSIEHNAHLVYSLAKALLIASGSRSGHTLDLRTLLIALPVLSWIDMSIFAYAQKFTSCCMRAAETHAWILRE